MRSFSDWSTWFEDGLAIAFGELQGSRTALIVVMAWIMSNADSEGGLILGKSEEGWESWAVRETPLAGFEFGLALRDLVKTRMLQIVTEGEGKYRLQVQFDGRLEEAA